jgi:hypothetical protein
MWGGSETMNLEFVQYFIKTNKHWGNILHPKRSFQDVTSFHFNNGHAQAANKGKCISGKFRP